MPLPDLIRVRHMLDAARLARMLLEGKKRADLDRDIVIVLATMKAVEIIGEAASKTTAEFRAAHADVPWEEIVGMRHRLIHGYYDINRDILWRTVSDDLPPLIETLERIASADS
jgi:uncharacterized protein with HEPN domain